MGEMSERRVVRCLRGSGTQAAQADGTAGAAAGAAARPGGGLRKEPPGPKIWAVSVAFNVSLYAEK